MHHFPPLATVPIEKKSKNFCRCYQNRFFSVFMAIFWFFEISLSFHKKSAAPTVKVIITFFAENLTLFNFVLKNFLSRFHENRDILKKTFRSPPPKRYHHRKWKISFSTLNRYTNIFQISLTWSGDLNQLCKPLISLNKHFKSLRGEEG